MIESSVTLGILGVLGTCVAGLIWVMKYVFGTLKPLLEETLKATQANTKATNHADQYLRERNGRDNAMHKQLLEATQAIPSTLKGIADEQARAIVKAVKVQNVQEQTVHSQIIEQKPE